MGTPVHDGATAPLSPTKWRRWRRRLFVALVVLAVALNGVAYLHGRAMTHWSAGATRTSGPEELGTLEKLMVLCTGVSIPRPMDSRSPADLGLVFESTSFVNGAGDELAAWVIPAKEPTGVVVALFHGYSESKSQVLDAAREFHLLGCETVLVDFYGSGGSSGSGTTLGVREAVDVGATVAYCRLRWPRQRLVLYAYSMGGAAVLRAIARGGATPDAIVLEAPFDRLVTTTGNRFRAMGLPATPFAELLVFWGGSAAGIDGFDLAPIEDAPSVGCPALFLHGADDQRVTLEQARGISAAIGGPTRLVVFDGAGHEPLVRADRERWVEAVAASLGTR